MTDYRFTLERTWSEGGGIVLFVGLNPSTADETSDDPTLRRCIGFARRWGYSGLRLVNLYAARATRPASLKVMTDPVGQGNDAAIVRCAEGVELVVAAWGNQGHTEQRSRKVLELLNCPVYCLQFTASGAPRHPLYARKELVPELFYEPSSRVG